jgi:ketosteroid isomerase-like protein
VAEVTRLEAVWNGAHLRIDASALDRLWADELVAIVPKMTPLPKQDALAFLRSGRMKFLRYESSDLTVRVYGDTAVATGRLLRSRELGGQTMQDYWRFTKVYVRGGGQWRVIVRRESTEGGR